MGNETRIHELLPRQHIIIQKINQQLCDNVRAKFPNNEEKVRNMSIIEDGQIRMAHLAVYGCHMVNGVAELHSKNLRENVFKDFSDLYPDKFTNVTNGVTQRRWLLHANRPLADFITKRIGKDGFRILAKWQNLASFAKDQTGARKSSCRSKRKTKSSYLNS